MYIILIRNCGWDKGLLFCERMNSLTLRLGVAIQVHRELGPGLMESAYEACLYHELSLSGLKIEKQKAIPIFYKGIKLDAGYRLDLVVEEQVIAEIKAVSELIPIHEAQLLSYLKQAVGDC